MPEDQAAPVQLRAPTMGLLKKKGWFYHRISRAIHQKLIKPFYVPLMRANKLETRVWY